MWVSVEVTPGDLVEPVGHHGRDVVVVAHPDQRDQVDLAGDGVDLAHAVEGGDRLGDLGDAGDVGLDEDDGGDHGASASGPGRCTATRQVAAVVEGHQVEPRLRRRRRGGRGAGWRRRPGRSTRRRPRPGGRPADSSQRRIFSVSSAVAAGTGPGPPAHRLGAGDAARRRTGGRRRRAGSPRPRRAGRAGRRGPPSGPPSVARGGRRPARGIGSGRVSRWVRAAARTNAASRSRWTPASSNRSSVGQRGHPRRDQPRRRRRGAGSRVSRSWRTTAA